MDKITFAILGGGNLGSPLADGIYQTKLAAGKIILTRRNDKSFSVEQREKFKCTTDNASAVKNADIIVIAVQPKQLEDLINSISKHLCKDKKQLIISVVTGATIEKIQNLFGKSNKNLAIARAMPNTSLKTGNSMTCLAFNKEAESFKEKVQEIFNSLGETLIIKEEMFPQATVLCGSGIAIMARFIRVYMQAGIQSGFNEEASLQIAIQLMKGTAMLLKEGVHPEVAIDKVTTPGGCTITTLAEMEHCGLSSALLKAIEAGITKARTL